VCKSLEHTRARRAHNIILHIQKQRRALIAMECAPFTDREFSIVAAIVMLMAGTQLSPASVALRARHSPRVTGHCVTSIGTQSRGRAAAAALVYFAAHPPTRFVKVSASQWQWIIERVCLIWWKVVIRHTADAVGVASVRWWDLARRLANWKMRLCFQLSSLAHSKREVATQVRIMTRETLMGKEANRILTYAHMWSMCGVCNHISLFTPSHQVQTNLNIYIRCCLLFYILLQ
jgi:hypothetical protein